jgi:excisionase family DNA binding protein
LPSAGYVTLQEAADYYGVTDRTVRRLIADGYLPAERLGPRLLRIRAADLDKVGQQVPSAAA